MSVPTYAYAANNPLRYVDPTGRDVRFLSADPGRVFAASAELLSLAGAPGDIGRETAALISDPDYHAVFDLDSAPSMQVGDQVFTPEAYTSFMSDGSYTQVTPAEVGTSLRRTIAHELGHTASARAASARRGGMCNTIDRTGSLKWPADRFRNRVQSVAFELWAATHNGLDAFGDVDFLHVSGSSIGQEFPWSRW